MIIITILKSQTAILFFSRTAEEESKAKTFVSQGGRSVNVQIAQKLIKRSLRVAVNSKLPVYSCFSNQQHGNSFGERIANAVTSVFDKGYQKVIIIGNDTPNLSTALIKKANQRLTDQNVVLGSSVDGGVYLIGINQSTFDRQAFVDLKWNSSNLQVDWSNYAYQFAASIEWLTSLKDVDSENDLMAFVHGAINTFRNHLVSLISVGVKCYRNSVINIAKSLLLTRNISFRAPPF